MNLCPATRCAGRGPALPELVLACLALAVALLLTGCAVQRISEQSQQSLAAGDYENALQALDQGLKEYPDSTILRSAMIQARGQAVAAMTSKAASLRSAGKFDQAQVELERALLLDPQNRRLEALIVELGAERRQQAALAEAEQLEAAQRPDAALRVIEQALKSNPRHAGLLAAQRRIEITLRQAQLSAAQSALAETRPISLDFRDASLRTVIDVVSRNSGINFILDRDIRPDTQVTIFLRQARLEDALDLIVATNQLAKKVVDSQTIVIYPNTPEKQREYQEQIVRVFYLASTEAKGAALFLKSMLKIREPFVDDRTNMLALRESHENIRLAERLVALYDTADPEVILEVEVLEISSTRLTELGIKYPDRFLLTPLPPPGAAGLTLGNIQGMGADRIGLTIAPVLVNLKREVGDYTTLANPKIRTRNKEKAKVLIGEKLPIVTSTIGTGGFVSDSVSYLDVGLKLDVEPTIYADDEVAIKISLEVSNPGSAVRTSSGTLAYQITTRNATTVLRLRDGETQLLAGLIGKDDRTSSSRIPGLGDIPVLGRLFSTQTDDTKRTELVLAITPRIVRNIRRADASEVELWIGTEAFPRLRPVGGLRAAAPFTESPKPAEGAPAGANRTAPGLAALSATSAPPTQGARPAPLPATAPELKWSGPAEAKVGDTVELNIALNSQVPLRGLPLEIDFTFDRLELTEVLEGEFFKQDGAATSFSKSGDGKDGRIRAGVLRNQATGIGGQGTVLTLRFKAIAAGPAEVQIGAAQALGLGSMAPNPALPAPFSLQIR